MYIFPYCNQRKQNVSHQKHIEDVCLALTCQGKKQSKRDYSLCIFIRRHIFGAHYRFSKLLG